MWQALTVVESINSNFNADRSFYLSSVLTHTEESITAGYTQLDSGNGHMTERVGFYRRIIQAPSIPRALDGSEAKTHSIVSDAPACYEPAEDDGS